MYNDIITDVHFKNEFKLNKVIEDGIMSKILVVEDDEKIIRILKIQLEHQQFDITIEKDGIEAMNNVDKNRDVYDLIILDLGLPGMSGNKLCKNIRKISETPIIVLSARNSVEEKVELLQNGAGDYITKPFDISELSARILVNIRKQKKENLIYKDIDINVDNYTVKISNELVSLSKTEFEMGSAKFFGTDTKPLCAKAERAVELFATFNPESAFHPSWGLDRAQAELKKCK